MTKPSSIADLRRHYGLGSLRREDLNPDPFAQFNYWFEDAARTKALGSFLRRVGIATYKWFQIVFGKSPAEANAMTLATADKTGRPTARIVLLKGVDKRGFIFFTNYQSRKAQELTENPHGALNFYWAELERQVCVAGAVRKISREESEAYFNSRPKGSRLAAWVSSQSEAIANRKVLEERMQQLMTKYLDEEVPLPPHWGGYVLSPTRIEFWQGRPNRLHDRFCYTSLSDGRWLVERLAP